MTDRTPPKHANEPHRPPFLLTAGLLTGLALMLAAGLVGPSAARADIDLPSGFRKFETRYYIMYTDLPVEKAREAAVRMTCMAEEYHSRTKGFAGAIKRKLPFMLCSSRVDYHKLGGIPGSAGVYIQGRALMALGSGPSMWHVVQHEGFHQFVHMVIGGRIPIWVNEGLAEYFGSGVWTGDGLVTGVADPRRVKRVQGYIKANKILPMLAMLKMSHQEWNAALAMRNYDQAWSMVHFLVHAEKGKYRKAFRKFINDISRRRDWAKAYVRRFGRDTKAFEKKYSEYWMNWKRDNYEDRISRAVVETLTSYLARSEILNQDHPDANSLFSAITKGEVQVDPKKQARLWLPNSLGQQTVKQSASRGKWTLTRPGKGEHGKVKLTLTAKDGTIFTGTYTLQRGKRPDIDVDITQSKGKTDDEAD
ncbi:MAG: DUF1570 domain-containing protein [Planctomycetota bacterium]